MVDRAEKTTQGFALDETRQNVIDTAIKAARDIGVQIPPDLLAAAINKEFDARAADQHHRRIVTMGSIRVPLRPREKPSGEPLFATDGSEAQS
jgi:hypothetical protein